MVISTVTRTISDTVGAANEQITDTLFGAPIRLGVTGLARSGKTVFITSLVANLLEQGRMSQLHAMAQGRIETAFLQPQPNDTVARFDYEGNLAALTGPTPRWPDNTKTISQLRVSLKVKPNGMLSGFRSAHIQHLDIIDYPGEWLLDLSLLDKSYEDWSKDTLARLSYRKSAQTYLNKVSEIDPNADLDEPLAKALTQEFTTYLNAAREDGYSDLTPGRFLLPGDLQGSPVLTFAPLTLDGRPPRGSLGREFKRRFEAYKSNVVRPFFRDHFARIDRQIVLVDVLGALHNGPRAIDDLRRTMRDILKAFRPGTNSTVSRLLRGARVDRILFAATKADHLHQSQHASLNAMMQALTDDAAREARFKGAQTLALSIASVRSTTEETRPHNGTDIDCVRGTVLDTGKQAVFFAGELPSDPQIVLSQTTDLPETWLEGEFSAMRFSPPPSALRHGEGIAHIRLDRAAEYLFGDRL